MSDFPIDEFFADELSVAATFTPGGGGTASTIKVVVERSDQANESIGMQFRNVGLQAFARTSDVSAAVAGVSTLTISAIVYNIKSLFVDGEGITSLELSRD